MAILVQVFQVLDAHSVEATRLMSRMCQYGMSAQPVYQLHPVRQKRLPHLLTTISTPLPRRMCMAIGICMFHIQEMR